MSNTIQTGSTQSINLDLLQRATETSLKELGAGAGIVAGGQDAPPVVPPETQSKLVASLTVFMSASGSKIDTDVLLVQIAVSMRDTEATNEKGKINREQESKKNELKEKEAKIAEALKKQEEAERAANSGNIFDKIKLAFEWLGAILAAAVAAVMIATGVGAVVGALLIAAAVTSLIMAVDSTVQTATGLGIAGNIAKAAGADPETIAKADMGFRIGMAVLGIALSIAAGGAQIAGSIKAAVSAGMSAAEAGNTARQVVQAAKDAFMSTLKEAGAALSQTARTMQRAAEGTSAAVTAGSAAMDAGRAGLKYEETTARADAKKLEGEAKEHEAIMQMIDDMIDQALSRLMAASDRFNNILDDIMAAVNDRGQTLSKARFAG